MNPEMLEKCVYEAAIDVLHRDACVLQLRAFPSYIVSVKFNHRLFYSEKRAATSFSRRSELRPFKQGGHEN